jgi:uncharacterized protein
VEGQNGERTADWCVDFSRRLATATLPPMYDPWTLAGAMLVVLLGAALQGAIGFGFAVVAAPILTLLDPGYVPVAPQILVLPMGVAALMRERAGADFSGLGWVVTGRVPGSLVAALVLGVATAKTLDLLIGGLVLVAVLILGSGLTVPLNRTTRFWAGLVSGFTGTASSIGGPPVALLYRTQSGPTVRATLGTIFSIGIVINLIVLAVTGLIVRDDLVISAILAPAAVIGFAASSLVTKHVEGRILRNGILIVATVSAVALIVRGVLR